MALAIDPHPDSAERSVHLASRAGRLLFLSGADTQHVLTGVSGVAQGLGQEVHVLVTPEAILATVGTTERFVTRLGPEFSVPSVNMQRLAAVETLIDDIRGGLNDADIIEQRLDAIELSPQGYSDLTAIIGVRFTTASLAKLFGAEWSVVAVAFVAGIVSAALRKIFAKFSLNPFVSVFIVAALSGLTAILVLRLVPHASPVLALTAAGMILVPGVPLINGIREISSGNAANGVARLATGAASILTIAFALYAVGSLSGATLPIDRGPGSYLPPRSAFCRFGGGRFCHNLQRFPARGRVLHRCGDGKSHASHITGASGYDIAYGLPGRRLCSRRDCAFCCPCLSRSGSDFRLSGCGCVDPWIIRFPCRDRRAGYHDAGIGRVASTCFNHDRTGNHHDGHDGDYRHRHRAFLAGSGEGTRSTH